MLALILALSVVAIVEVILGGAPLRRTLALVLGIVLYLLFAIVWGAACFSAPRLARLVDPLPGGSSTLVLFAPPAAAAISVLWLLRRSGRPRWLWSTAAPRGKLSTRLGIDAAVLVLWLVGGNALAAYRERRVDRAWAATLAPMDFDRRYLKAAATPSARRLQELAAQLGIDTGEGGPHPSEEDRKLFESIRVRLARFVAAQTGATTDSLAVPSADLRAFLVLHASDLAEMRSLARGGGSIGFGMDVEADRMPSLAWQRPLQSVLVLGALEEARRGRSEVALDALDAVWTIDGGLRTRPELISQLIAASMDTSVLGALRHLDSVPESWQERLRALDYRRALLSALQYEAWSLSEFARHRRGSVYYVLLSRNIIGDWSRWQEQERAETAWMRSAFFRYVQEPLERPYLRLSASESSERWRRTLEALADEDPCATNLARVEERWASVPAWNLVARSTAFSPLNIWKTTGRDAAETDLTRKVLEVREARALSPDHAWPAALASPESTACRGLRWSYAVGKDGSASIAAEENPFAGQAGAPTLAFRLAGRRP